KMEVRLRNVGKADIKFTYILLREHPPRVTAADGVRMSVSMPPSPRYYVPPTEKTLKPGETISLYNPEVAVEPEDPILPLVNRKVDSPTIFVSPGKYTISFGGMLTSHPTLSTGTVEFEVKDVKAAAVEGDVTAWGKESGGLQAGLSLKGAKRVYRHGDTVTL